MSRLTFFALILGFALAANSSASDFPAYYPKEGIGRAGQIDAVHVDENRVVIDDVEYKLSDDVVVHSLSAYSVPKARLRAGLTVAFKVGADRAITKFWLLPAGYDTRRRR